MNIFADLFNKTKKLDNKLLSDAPLIISNLNKALKPLKNKAGKALVADANNATSTAAKEQQLNTLLKALIAGVTTSTTGVPVVAPDAITLTASKMIIEKLEIPVENAIGKKLES